MGSAQPQLATFIVVPDLRNNADSADQTNITSGNSAFLKFGGTIKRFTLMNNTGTAVYVLAQAQTVTAAATKGWFHWIIPGNGIPIDFNIAVAKLALFVPAGGTTLEYKSATKNFACVGYNLSI